MKTFGERVRSLRIDLGLSQRQLGSLIKSSGATISNWETGVTEPVNIKSSLIYAAAEQLKSSVEYLVSGIHPSSYLVQMNTVQETPDESDVDAESGVMLTVHDLDISAGPGRVQPEFTETTGKLYFSRAWMNARGAKPEDLRVARVRGDSMQPFLYDGDSVVINLKKTRLRDGHVFALAYGNEARVKRTYWLANGALRIVSDNSDKTRYPDEVVEGDALNAILIIGQVIHRMGEGGT